MRFLEQFVEAPLAGTLGWALLHSLWEGAIISALLAAVLLLFRSPRIRYAAACSATIAMVGGFALTLTLLIPGQVHRSQNIMANGFSAWNFLSDHSVSDSWNLNLGAIAPWLGPFWITGVWLFCLLRLASWISVQRLRSRGVCCASEFWQNKIAQLSARMRVTRPVQLLESFLVDVPLVLGHLRPVILIPIGLFSGLPVGQIETILLHELAHIRRHDYMVNAMQRLIESLFFYHPATWWISGVIRNEREHSCDDVVVSMIGDPHEYALVLAALERNRISSRESGLAATGGHLMKRIHRLLHRSQSISALAPLLAVAILLATGAVSLAALRLDPSKQVSTATQVPVSTSAKSAYSEWIDQDVVYIIDDAERAAFQSLASDEERDHFIDQFWERRNPTPGSSQNTFKEEHYRRIAYANKHFQTPSSGTLGWRTDRGHMYIVYGPPDEMEAHAKGQQKPFATEIWLYRHVEGIGENGFVTFIDRTGRGDFHLAPGNAR
jgi:GWxTD domain-containing protein